MKKKCVVGRSEEIRLLEKYYESNKSELIVSVKTTCRRKIFQRQINKLTKNKNGKANNWFEAFENLKEYLLSLNKEKVVVFLDELPWMDTAKSNFLAAFSSFWNGWRNNKTILKLYVCGSATTWMVDRLI